MMSAREMPRYRCHKEVWAFKIKAIVHMDHAPCVQPVGLTTCGYGPDERMHLCSTDPIAPPAGRHDYRPLKPSNPDEYVVGAVITPTEDGYADIAVDHAYIKKHNPQVGGYYVVYMDDYNSYSPAAAFEDGYT